MRPEASRSIVQNRAVWSGRSLGSVPRNLGVSPSDRPPVLMATSSQTAKVHVVEDVRSDPCETLGPETRAFHVKVPLANQCTLRRPNPRELVSSRPRFTAVDPHSPQPTQSHLMRSRTDPFGPQIGQVRRTHQR